MNIEKKNLHSINGLSLLVSFLLNTCNNLIFLLFKVFWQNLCKHSYDETFSSQTLAADLHVHVAVWENIGRDRSLYSFTEVRIPIFPQRATYSGVSQYFTREIQICSYSHLYLVSESIIFNANFNLHYTRLSFLTPSYFH